MKWIIVFLTMFAVSASATTNTVNSSNLSGYQGIMIPYLSVTIASSATTSAAINQNGFSLVSCIFPAAFTGTTISFTASADGVTYVPVYNSAGLVSYTVAPSRYLSINPSDVQGAKYLKIVSGSTEAAGRTLTCSLKGI